MSEVKSTEVLEANRAVDLGEGALGTMEVGRWDDAEMVRPPEQKRGTVQGFSRRSRSRLLDTISSIDRSKAPPGRWRFVTLTYQNVPKDEQKVGELWRVTADGRKRLTPRETKRHLRAFVKRLIREFGEVAGKWKLEPQKRGMPHYHLLLLMPEICKGDVEAEREWFARSWAAITEGTEDCYRVHRFGGDNHRAAWQQLEDWEHITGYTGKYVGKVVEVPNESEWTKAGRWWGTFNGHLLPVKLESHTFTVEQSTRLQRTMRRLSVAKAREKGFKLDMNHEWLTLSHSTWASRKALRAAGLKIRRTKAWIPAGMGGRLYIDEGEGLRLCHFAIGSNLSRSGVVLNPPDTIPF